MREFIGGLLAVGALAVFCVAVFGLIRGHIHWAGIQQRKHAGIAIGLAFLAFIVSGLILPKQSKNGPEATHLVEVGETTAPSSARTTASPTRTTTATISATTTHTTTTTTATTALATPSPAPNAFVDTNHDDDNHVVVPPPQPQPQPQPQPEPAPAPAASYGSCAEAKAAGAAPLYAGQPGYSSKLDRDGDGVACEN